MRATRWVLDGDLLSQRLARFKVKQQLGQYRPMTHNDNPVAPLITRAFPSVSQRLVERTGRSDRNEGRLPGIHHSVAEASLTSSSHTPSPPRRRYSRTLPTHRNYFNRVNGGQWKTENSISESTARANIRNAFNESHQNDPLQQAKFVALRIQQHYAKEALSPSELTKMMKKKAPKGRVKAVYLKAKISKSLRRHRRVDFVSDDDLWR